MNRAQVILIFVSLVIVLGLFFLPKVVVTNDTNLSQEVEVDSAHMKSTASVVQPSDSLAFSYKLDLFKAASDEQDSIKLLKKIIEDLQRRQHYDSAAFIAAEVADDANTLSYYTLAGQAYYEAFTFAIAPERINLFAEGVRLYYNKALALNADLPTAKVHIGMSLVNSENPMEGILMIRKVLDEYPENEQALFSLGVLSMQSGQFDKALERFSTLETLGKGSVQTVFYRGICLKELGEFDKALQVLEEALRQAEDESVRTTIQSYINEM